MTNEEAIIVLENCAFMLKDGTRFMKPEHEAQFREAYGMGIKALERKNVNAEWIPLEPNYEYYACSKCRSEYTIFSCEMKRYNFCPNCGADMRQQTK